MFPRMVLIAVLGCPLVGTAATYQIAPAPGARFGLLVDKTGLMSGKQHVFVFEKYKGTLTYDADLPEQSRVDFSLAAASLTCTDTWVSEKDRRKIEKVALEDMLAAAAHPEIVFRSEKVTRGGPKSFEVAGRLSIRGVERPATVAVTVEGSGAKPERVSGRAVVRLKDYGLKPPGAALGTIGTKNEMTVEFVLLPR